MRLTFRGTRALILGGSCEIGLSLMRLAREAGLTVIPTHASNRGKAAIAAVFPDLAEHCPHLDLSDRASVDALCASGPADIDYVLDLAQGHFEGLMAANVDADAYFAAHITNRQRLLRHLARSMLAQRFGRLVHVSSTAASLPAAGQGFYSAAKRASEALYQSLGLELGPRGLTALSLRLGLVDAGRGKQFLDNSDRRVAITHIVSVEQAASTLLFLLSDQAAAFTCTTLTMDAGLTAHKYL